MPLVHEKLYIFLYEAVHVIEFAPEEAPRSRNADETDLMVLHALQIAPRASWAEIGAAIGVAPTTVARRWLQLAERGEAWITAYVASPYSRLSLVHIDVEAGIAEQAVRTLGRLSALVTIDEVSGTRPLLATLVAPSTERMATALRRIRGVPGVLSCDAVLSTSVLAHGSRWRLDALDPEQVAVMQRVAGVSRSAPMPHIDDFDRELVRTLRVDGRASATELAQRLSVSVNTVRRRIGRLLDSGWLTMRCDLSAAVSGHEVVAYLWFRVPPEELVAAGEAIAALPERRTVATLAGRHNLLVIAWLHRPEDLPGLEVRISEACPSAVVDDRSVALRKIKHVGRVLGPDGRVVEVVPIDEFA